MAVKSLGDVQIDPIISCKQSTVAPTQYVVFINPSRTGLGDRFRSLLRFKPALNKRGSHREVKFVTPELQGPQSLL